MSVRFVHLHLHTEYSMSDSLLRIKGLMQAAAEQRMPALAVTEQSNLFSLVKFYRAAQAAGIKPIIGVDVWLFNEERPQQPDRLILLAQNDQGYANLRELVSRSYREGQQSGRPMMHRAWLNAEYCQGLIALSGGRDGDVGRALLSGQKQEARRLLEEWLACFGDRYYLQLVRTGREGEEACVQASVELAACHRVPVVATNEVCFLRSEDYQAHEVRVCIHQGRTLDDPRRPRRYSDQQYLRSAEEMANLFADIPEALENTVEIAKRCNVRLTLGKNYLPDFPIPKGSTTEAYFRQLAHEGLEERLHAIFDPQSPDFAEQRKPYDARLETELGVIIEMGFPGYFLIVADFIQWAKQQGIPVGPGRGSGAGSLVAYALKITDLDPLEHDLLFERFLNPERVSMPDFDIDFCMDKRDRVIEYVAHKYGRDAVSQIITYGSMAAKAVVRDVGRVLGHPHGFTDRVAKMIPFELGITLKQALEDSEELGQAYETDEEIRELIDMAMQLEGLTRNAGKHAGGVVIAPGKLTDFTPLYCEADGSNLVTQFDKNDVEAVGLVKFDFLGLRTLTIIDWALTEINHRKRERGETPVDIGKIPMDDPQAFELLKSARTTAVFQLESHGMKDLIRKLQPDCFDDITALVALFRPGPLGSGMVDDFIARKHGLQEVAYPHPKLEPILKSTYGVILYQEQVMQIAQVLAGYTLGGADLLRRAMGKKKPEEMARQGEIFCRGAVERGVDEALARYIFDLMEKFAGYGFNKSHSAAYALVSYQTLWLKTHYPAEFMAAVLSADMDNTDKVVHLIEECRAMGLQVLAPQINRSAYRFSVAGQDTIVYGLGAIKGVGEAAIESMIVERKAHGPYENIFDFCQRIDLRKCNRRVLEALIRSGALDDLGPNRATLMHQLPLALKLAEQHHARQASGQGDLFGTDASSSSLCVPLTETVPEWPDRARLDGEKSTLGLFLSGHPMDFYQTEVNELVGKRIGELHLQDSEEKGQRSESIAVAGLIAAINKRTTRRGMMASVLLEDQSGRIEAALFNETLEQCQEVLQLERVVCVRGQLVADEYRGGMSLRVESMQPLEALRAQRLQILGIHIDPEWLEQQQYSPDSLVEHLQELLGESCPGPTRVEIHYRNSAISARIRLGERWRVEPSDRLLERLTQIFGKQRLSFHYAPALPVEKAKARV